MLLIFCRFPAGVGIMVNGMLEARGKGPNDILMTLREEPPKEEESTTIVDLPKISSENQPNVRLIGGATANEGTLQVNFLKPFVSKKKKRMRWSYQLLFFNK